MPSINDLLHKAESDCFIGREAELQLMQEQLQTHWHILHFYAMKGMGKTALFKRFAKSLSEATVLYIHPEIEFQTPQQFSERIFEEIIASRACEQNAATPSIATVIKTLNANAKEESPIILLFDSLELWQPIIEWLFEEFIPQLSSNIRLFTAGSDPLTGKWLHTTSWSLLVKNIQLKPLNSIAVRKYLELVNVTDPTLQQTISRLSNGIPFAVHLCCKMVKIDEQQFTHADMKRTIQMLCEKVFDNLSLSAEYYTLLEAASVVRQFDKELLIHITNQPLHYDQFNAFCNMQIIKKQEDGWSIVDGIRNWIQKNFKEHSPELFILYNKRAFEALRRRWKATPFLKRKNLFIENVYAAENELLREFHFLVDEAVYDRRTSQECDLPVIEKIWRNNVQTMNDGTEQEKLFYSIWKLEPSSFQTFWANSQIVGFASIVSLTKETRDIFHENKLYRNYLQNSKVEHNERLFWVAGTTEKNDYETLNVIYRYLFEKLMDNCLNTVLLPTHYDISGLLSIGFVELPWAASVSPSGKEFRLLQLDVREMSLMRLLTTSYPGNESKSITHLEVIQWTKKALASFHDMDMDVRKQAAMIITQDEHQIPDEQVIRSALQLAMEQVANKSEKNRLMMRTLQLSYIECIGSNEIVAQRLHLSISTFYRYMKMGIQKVAQQLLQNE